MRVVKRKPYSDFSSDFSLKIVHWTSRFETFAWLDSNQYSQKYSNFEKMLAVGEVSHLQTDTKNAFFHLKKYVDSVKDYVVGYLSYDLKNDVENLISENNDNLQFPGLYFFQPQKLFIFHKDYIEISYHISCENEMKEDLKSIEKEQFTYKIEKSFFEIQQRISKEDYKKKFSKLKEYIVRGDTYEANFCMEFFAQNIEINPLHVFLELNEVSKTPFSVWFRNKNQYLISASPERFVKKEGKKIITQPIKGTAKRSKDAEMDLQFKRQLEKSNKEKAENIMIVDLVRNDLSVTASRGSVKVEELCKVYSFSTVHQMISTVVSELRDGIHPVDVVKSLFPMGSMTGAPKISSMKIIEELEETKRGLYSGSFGYFAPNGDFDFNVVIRSFLYNTENQYLSFSVGGAITAQSQVEQEYEECLLKSESLHRILNNFLKN